MSKKLIALILSAALCGTLLASCGTPADDTTDTTDDTTVETPADTDAPDESLSISEIADAITNQYGELYDPTNELAMPLLSYSANFAKEDFNLVFPGVENPEEALGMPVSEYIATDLSLYSLESAWIDEIAVKKATMMNVDTLIIVKPTEGNEETVLNTLTAYADMQKDGWAYPQNLPKLQAIQCYEKGGYVFCYVLGVISDDLTYAVPGEGEYADYTEADLEQAKIDAFAAENQKATDVINSILGE